MIMGPFIGAVIFATKHADQGGDTAVGSTELIVAALGAGSLGAIVAAIVTGIFSKKKLGAEATEIITKAAAGVVSSLNDEVERMRVAMRTMTTEHRETLHARDVVIEDMAREHAEEREDWKRVLQLHVAWDAIAIAKLGELNVDLPPAPPLLPPRYGRGRPGVHWDESSNPDQEVPS